MNSSSNGKVAVGQRNYMTNSSGNLLFTKDKMIVTNNAGKKISMSGDSSTALAVETGKIKNEGTIDMRNSAANSSEGSTGIYGADGSEIENGSNGIISINSYGAGIVGQNNLYNSQYHGGMILTNSGTIKGEKSGTENIESIVGMYADNRAFTNSTTGGISTEVTTSNSVLNNSGLIDISAATKSVGIYARKSKVNLSGTAGINIGKENLGFNGIYSEVNVAGGTYTLDEKSVGFVNEMDTTNGGFFNGTTGTVDITGKNSTVYYFNNSTVTSASPANSAGKFLDNLSITESLASTSLAGNDIAFNYIYGKNSNIAYDNSVPKIFNSNKVIFMNAVNDSGATKNVSIGTNTNITLNGSNSIGVYSKNMNEAKNLGKFILKGIKSVGIYGEGTGSIVNEGANAIIQLDTTSNGSVGIYTKGSFSGNTVTGTNRSGAKILLDAENTKGMLSENTSGTLENDGTIESVATNNKHIGMAAIGGNNLLLNNSNGLIDLKGNKSEIGMYTDGTGTQIIRNEGIIKLEASYVNPSTQEIESSNIGIYSKGSGDTIRNDGKILAKDYTIGIYAEKGADITLGSSSITEVGKRGVGVFSTGKNITIENGATLNVGSTENNDPGVGVYYTGSNGTITNNTTNIGIGNGSIGFVIKGGSGNKLDSNNPSNGIVALNKESMFIYSEDSTGTVNNSTNLNASSGNDEVYGIYTRGGGTNHGTIDFSNSVGSVGIYSYTPYVSPILTTETPMATPEKYLNKGTIHVSQSDTNNIPNRYGIGMAAGAVRDRVVYLTNPDGTPIYKSDGVTQKSVTYREVLGIGNIENHGEIYVKSTAGNPDNIGMYAGGTGSVAKNYGTIYLSGPERNIGMFIEDGAIGENHGTIKTIGTGNSEQIGVALLRGAKFINGKNGKIEIDATDGIGIAIAGNVTLVNEGEFVIKNGNTKAEMNTGGTVSATGTDAQAIVVGSNNGSKEMGYLADSIGSSLRNDKVSINVPDSGTDATISLNGVDQPIFEQTFAEMDITGTAKDALVSDNLGIYMDTYGRTNPIMGIGLLMKNNGMKVGDIIIGTEVTETTNSKYIEINQEIIDPYSDMIVDSMNTGGVKKWQFYSSSLTWMGTAVLDQTTNRIANVYLAKVPYTVWSGKSKYQIDMTDTFNFLDGLEQRYGVEALGTKERELFQKITSIGENEDILLFQAFDEMMGHQYGNIQQRMASTGGVLDKEFTHLRKEWETKSKESNKIKAFGVREEYKTDTAGIKDYTSNGYGVAYVHEDETIKLGASKGWYAGVVVNNFKLKDIGKSDETTALLKAGVFKSIPFDHNNSLNWTISAEGFVSNSTLNRRYLVVDTIYSAKSDYYGYGVGLINELSKEFRTSERTSIKPYGMLKMEYGKLGRISEKSGEIKLEVDSSGYYSIRPELGIEFKYKQPMAVKTSFVTTLGLAYGNELGKVGSAGSKLRVKGTEADWYNIRTEKDDRKGNFKADLNLGIENERVGFTLNLGYDTKGENVRGGIGFRAIY